MRFLFGVNKSKTKIPIIFVCVQNAGRSQMAEGFFRKYTSKDYESISAGTKPTSEINPVATLATLVENGDTSRAFSIPYRKG